MTQIDISRAERSIRACPIYKPTPTLQIEGRGSSIIAKDERQRFGLGAFKALGGVYAVMQLIKEASGDAELNPQGANMRATARSLTFVCASAGNHGMAVAAGAALCGAACRVHLADSVPERFAEGLRDKGATVLRSGERYADAVAAAIKDGESPGHVHLADGSWPGYTYEPALVMEGYTVMAEELREQFEQQGHWPDTVWLQAGVGGFAAAITLAIRKAWPQQPDIVIVEPATQASVAAALAAGEPVTIDGDESSMGRLDCELASLLAFDILANADVRCTTVTDEEVATTVKQLGNDGVTTTPSGAAGISACWREGKPDHKHLVFITEA